MHHAVSGCVYAKALNACCPAGPNARNTLVTTALSITLVSCRFVHFLVSYMTLARFGASTRAVAVPLEKRRAEVAYGAYLSPRTRSRTRSAAARAAYPIAAEPCDT